MKRLPKLGTSVWMTSRQYTGSGTVVDVHSAGEAADITIQDSKRRCWTSKKEQLHKPKSFGRCPHCQTPSMVISPDGYCNECHSH